MTIDEQPSAQEERRSRRPYGYWNDFGNVEQELRAFLQTLDAEGYMPTTTVFVRAGRSDLLSALQRHGGMLVVAARLGLRPWGQSAHADGSAGEVQEPVAATPSNPDGSAGADQPATAERQSVAQPPASPRAEEADRLPQPSTRRDSPQRGSEMPAPRQHQDFRRQPEPARGVRSDDGRRAHAHAARADQRWPQKNQRPAPDPRSRMFRTRCRLCGREIFSEQRAVLYCIDCGSRGPRRR